MPALGLLQPCLTERRAAASRAVASNIAAGQGSTGESVAKATLPESAVDGSRAMTGSEHGHRSAGTFPSPRVRHRRGLPRHDRPGPSAALRPGRAVDRGGRTARAAVDLVAGSRRSAAGCAASTSASGDTVSRSTDEGRRGRRVLRPLPGLVHGRDAIRLRGGDEVTDNELRESHPRRCVRSRFAARRGVGRGCRGSRCSGVNAKQWSAFPPLP